MDAQTEQIVLVTSLAFLFGIPVSVIQKIMLASQKNIEANAWQMLGSLVAVISTYGAIYFHQPAGIAVAAYSVTPAIVMLIATFLFFISNKNLRPSVHDFTLSHAKELMALGSYFFILSIITSVALNSDNIIISMILGAEAVTDYSVPAKLASTMGLLVTTLFLPLWAANAEAIERKDFSWVDRTARRSSVMGSIFVGGFGAALVFFGEWIIKLWMGRSFPHVLEIMLGFTLMYTLMAVTSPFQMILNSRGIIRVQISLWFIYLLSGVFVKSVVVGYFKYVAIVPFLSATMFFIFILPVTIRSAKNVYRTV